MSTTNSHDQLTFSPKLFLEELGYCIEPDSQSPDVWVWTAPTDESEGTFNSPVDALEAAWMDAVEQTISILGVTQDAWKALSFDEQKSRIMQALSGNQ